MAFYYPSESGKAIGLGTYRARLFYEVLSETPTQITLRAGQTVDQMKSYGTVITSATKIDGTQVTSGSASVSSIYASWYQWINEPWGTKTFDKGATARTVTISASFTVTNNGAVMGSDSTSTTMTIPALANGSDFSVPASVAAGSAIVVNINRQVSSYTHKVTITFGKKSYTASSVAASLSYTIPLTWLAEIPSSASGAATVNVETFSGSTKIGNTISKSTIITTPSTALPTVGTITIAQKYDTLSPAVPSTWNKYVQGRSAAVVSVSGNTGYQGSTISRVEISGGGYSTVGSSLTTGVLATSGTNTFTVKVTDSRGRVATATASITVTAYSPPKITSVTTQRANSAGAPDSSGAYALGTAVYTFDSVGGSNSISRAMMFRQTGASDWTSVGSFSSGTAVKFGGSLDTQQSYDVAYVITDAFGSVQRLDSLSRALPIWEVGNGGLTLAVGKEPGAFIGLDVAWEANFDKLPKLPGATVATAQLTANRTLYCDNVGGNDSNDGSTSAKAVKSLSRLAALANSVDEGAYSITLSFAPSSTSYGNIIVGGNSANLNYNKTWILTSTGAVTFGTVQTNSGGGLSLTGSAATKFTTGNFGCVAGGHVRVMGGVTLSAAEVTVYGGGYISCNGAGKVSATSSIRVTGGGGIGLGTCQEVTCAALYVAYGGQIYIDGPGSLTTTAGLYVIGGGYINLGTRSINVGTYLRAQQGGLIDFNAAPEVHVGTDITAYSGAKIGFQSAGSTTNAALITCSTLAALNSGELATNGRAYTGADGSLQTTVTSAGMTMRIRKWGNVVFVSVSEQTPTSQVGSGGALWTLPAAYRPLSGLSIPVITAGGAYNPGQLVINTDGTCKYWGTTSMTTGAKVNISGSWIV